MAGNDFEVIGSSWEIYKTHVEDKPFFVSFDADCDRPEIRELFGREARILIAIKHPNSNGAPSSEEAAYIKMMEEALVDSIRNENIAARLVAKIAFDGIREFVVELKDEQSFSAVIDEWKKEFSDYKIHMGYLQAWEYFNAMVWPSEEEWIMAKDYKVMSDLIAYGTDPTQVHNIEYLFIGNQEDLDQLRDALMKRHYVEGDSEDVSSLVMSIKLPLNYDDIINESILNDRLAKKYNCACDGWGASIVR